MYRSESVAPAAQVRSGRGSGRAVQESVDALDDAESSHQVVALQQRAQPLHLLLRHDVLRLRRVQRLERLTRLSQIRCRWLRQHKMGRMHQVVTRPKSTRFVTEQGFARTRTVHFDCHKTCHSTRSSACDRFIVQYFVLEIRKGVFFHTFLTG